MAKGSPLKMRSPMPDQGSPRPLHFKSRT
ncbi:hypothetical protein EVAR_71624_1, partial [Eumeta japonica]